MVFSSVVWVGHDAFFAVAFLLYPNHNTQGMLARVSMLLNGNSCFPLSFFLCALTANSVMWNIDGGAISLRFDLIF